MQKTTVYLDEASMRALKHMARQRRQPEARLIREAVRRLVGEMPRPALRCVGVASGPGDLSRKTDAYLAEGFGTERRGRGRRR